MDLTRFILGLVIYMASFLGLSYLAISWQKRQRKPKSPFKAETKLLRGPGETLLKKIAEMDEAFVIEFFVSFGTPLFFGLVAWWVTGIMGVADAELRSLAGLAALLVAMTVGCIALARSAMNRAKYYLGYFGERVVAEALEPLKSEGWRIYHDVPGDIGKLKFNVDHVAIGPGGVFAIETKARRKGGAIKGRKDQEVFYDGRKLRWPWGDEEPFGVKKAIDRSDWLAGWLEKVVGKPVPVRTILTFPEWFVKEVPNHVDPRLRVIPTSWLVGELKDREVVLSDRQIDFLARQIEQRCRDVEY